MNCKFSNEKLPFEFLLKGSIVVLVYANEYLLVSGHPINSY